jgi:carbamoyltransferase
VPACGATAPPHSRSRRSGLHAKSNTSFNVKGTPIVETPRDAVVCFLTTGIDHLVMHDAPISKNALRGIIGPLVGVYSDIAGMVRASAPPE